MNQLTNKLLLYQGDYTITSPFGPRVLTNGDARPHKGIDAVGIGNKNVVAPTNGRVVTSHIITAKNDPVWKDTWQWGHYVKMDDLNGYYLFFCHLSKRIARAGQTLAKGQLLGVEGETGYSFGSHLHFEVRRKSDGISIDPMEYLKILNEWEAAQVRKARAKIQERCKFDENTMKFIDSHPWPDDFILKLAAAMK